MEFHLTEAEDRERLDAVLAARVPAVSRMRLRQALDEGEVCVNGSPRPAGWRVVAGDQVDVRSDLAGSSAMTAEPIPLHILYEDEDLIAVEKPSDMVVHPAGRHRSGTLANALAYYFNVAGAADPPIRPGIVHRLDRATSGVMVVAKNQRSLSRLTVQFQQREPRKRYLALVHGRLEGAGEWEAPIGSDPEALPRWGIRENGRPARTRWSAVEQLRDYTLLALEPVTGRTNQLRLHSAHFGHPIAGDLLFGRPDDTAPGRLFLHAHRLELTHPTTGAHLVFEAPLPQELVAFLRTLSLECGGSPPPSLLLTSERTLHSAPTDLQPEGANP